jgi:hypothetical protein
VTSLEDRQYPLGVVECLDRLSVGPRVLMAQVCRRALAAMGPREPHLGDWAARLQMPRPP